MKKLIQFLHKTFIKSESTNADPVRSFFVGGKTEGKKLLYEKALRAAEIDQKKIIEEYNKKATHLQQI